MDKSNIGNISFVNLGEKINKRGDYKWGIVLSLILGLMVLSLSLYFIFNELWTGDEADRQVCRQSIQVRALLPDVTIAGIEGIDSFKDQYPLKCKTHVVEISEGDVERGEAGKIIAEIMAECWALYGKGDENAFPAEFFKSSSCVPCARIHLSDEAKTALGSGRINIREALDLKMDPQYSYYVYLRDSGKKFSAFDFGNSLSFDLSGEGFEFKDADWIWKTFELKNKLNGGKFNALMTVESVSLPEFFYAEKGDLLINYGIVGMGDSDFGDYVPYLFYFQSEDGKPFDEVKKSFVFDIPSTLFEMASDFFTLETFTQLPSDRLKEVQDASVGFCESWEGIPA